MLYSVLQISRTSSGVYRAHNATQLILDIRQDTWSDGLSDSQTRSELEN